MSKAVNPWSNRPTELELAVVEVNHAIDATDGHENWVVEMDGEDYFSAAAVDDGVVYVGGSEASVYALDADDGSELWKFETQYGTSSTPAVADGTVYTISQDRYVYAIDAADGSEQWRVDTGSGAYETSVADGTMFAGTTDSVLLALDRFAKYRVSGYRSDIHLCEMCEEPPAEYRASIQH